MVNDDGKRSALLLECRFEDPFGVGIRGGAFRRPYCHGLIGILGFPFARGRTSVRYGVGSTFSDPSAW